MVSAGLGLTSLVLPAASSAASTASFTPSATAQFSFPTGVDVDASGNVYVADTNNHAIRRVTADGVVSTLAGSGSSGSADGTGSAASFAQPYDVAVTDEGDVYVTDYLNHRIRSVTAGGVVTTFAGSGSPGYADGAGTSAQFAFPAGIVGDGTGGFLVTEGTGNRVRSITSTGVVALVAGSVEGAAGTDDGTGGSARFSGPWEITMSGGDAYVVDSVNHFIRRVTTAGVVTTPLDATGGLSFAYGIVADGSGGFYVADSMNHRILAVSAAFAVTVLAGSGESGFSDGTGTAAQFNTPFGIATHPTTGDLYVGDSSNNRIRRVTRAGVVTTFAGTGAQGLVDD